MIHKFSNPFKAKDSKKIETDQLTHDEISYVIDYPTTERIKTRGVSVEGWIVSKKGIPLKALRCKNGETYISIKPSKRADVAYAHTHLPESATLFSGFKVEVEYTGAEVSLEADFGEGFRVFHTFNFDLGFDVANVNYNPRLATNWADHVDLLEAKQSYYYEKPNNKVTKVGKKTPKTIAFYLPQFHPIPENDYAWGKGFTEWTNVASATPRFIGHRQPIFPADFGYYDLRVEDVMAQQIELAKQHGIYGFCFYYYWFSGKRVLEKPVDSFLRHKEWDFNFMICWANENWTKRWDGQDNEVILKQKSAKEDPLKFIKDVEPILLDKRYIRLDNKPVLVVYRPEKLVADNYVKVWRDYFKKKHKLELHLVTVWGARVDDPRTFGYDASVQFVPGALGLRPNFSERYTISSEELSTRLLDVNQSCSVVNYRRVAEGLRLDLEDGDTTAFPLYQCVMPSWDNDARRKGQGSTIFVNDSPDIYYHWLKETLDHQNKKVPFTFINAWNEWAEGAILEPSTHYGHAVLNRTGDAISGRKPTFQDVKRSKSAVVAAAVQILDVNEINTYAKELKQLNHPQIDTYVTLNKGDENYASAIREILPRAQVLYIPNRGKTILPFLHIARRAEIVGYQSMLRVLIQKNTSQKSKQPSVKQLLYNEKLINDAIEQTKKTPSYICVEDSSPQIPAGKVKQAKRLLHEVTGQKDLTVPRDTPMLDSCFWVSIAAIKNVVKFSFMPEDFEPEIRSTHGEFERVVSVVLRAAMNHANCQNYKATKGRLTALTKDV